VKLDLKRQEDFFRPLKEHPSHVLVTDIGSGPVNGGKEKVLKPFWNREASKEISRPLRRVVAHRDRLCRFAFDLLENSLCDSINGVPHSGSMKKMENQPTLSGQTTQLSMGPLYISTPVEKWEGEGIRAKKIRLYPTVEQKKILRNWMGASR